MLQGLMNYGAHILQLGLNIHRKLRTLGFRFGDVHHVGSKAFTDFTNTAAKLFSREEKNEHWHFVIFVLKGPTVVFISA